MLIPFQDTEYRHQAYNVVKSLYAQAIADHVFTDDFNGPGWDFFATNELCYANDVREGVAARVIEVQNEASTPASLMDWRRYRASRKRQEEQVDKLDKFQEILDIVERKFSEDVAVVTLEKDAVSEEQSQTDVGKGA